MQTSPASWRGFFYFPLNKDQLMDTPVMTQTGITLILRAQLAAAGIIVEITKDGIRWKRK